MTYRTADTAKRFSSGAFGQGRGIANETSGEGRIPFSDHHDWVKFSSNGLTHAAIDSDGRLWGWGEPPVGDGTLLPRKWPVLVSGEEWIDVSVGAFSPLPNQFFSSETGNPIPTGHEPRSWYRLRNTYVLAIKKSDGSLWGWGANNYGVLGNGRMSWPFCVSTHGVLSSGVESVSLVNTGKNIRSYNAPLVGLAVAVDHLSPVVDVTRLWAEAGADLDAPLRIERSNQSFLSESGGFFLPTPAGLQPPNAYGSGAVVRPRYYISVQSVPLAMRALFSTATGYRGTPSVESFVIRDSAAVSLGDQSVPASFDVFMLFQVEGVSEISQTRPYVGDVAVVFSPGEDGVDAQGVAVVGPEGFVTGVVITSPGQYSEIPTVAFHGTGGDATASPLCIGTVRGVNVTSEGEYREPGGSIGFRLVGKRASGLGDHPAYVANPGGRIGLAAYIEGFLVENQGSGYSASALKPLCAILDKPSSSSSFASSLVVGVCNLSRSAVVSLDAHFVGTTTPPMGMRVGNFRDRFLVSDAFKPLPGDGVISASEFNSYFQVSPVSHPIFFPPEQPSPTATLIFSQSGRTHNVTVTPVTAPGGEFKFRLSLSSDVAYSVADGIPYIYVQWPGFVSADPPPQVPSKSPTVTLLYRSLMFGPFLWSPGVTYEPVEGYRFSWEKVDSFLGGDLLTHQTPSLQADQVVAIPNQSDLPIFYPATGFVNTFRKIATSPLCASIVGVGTSLRPARPREHIRVHATGAETSGTPASVAAFYDADSPLAVGSNDVVRFRLDDGGSGYEKEPLFFAANFDLAPRLCNADRSYTDVQAGGADLPMCCAISGGRIYEWGHLSPSRSLSPTVRGFKLEVTITDVPGPVIAGSQFPGQIERYVSPILDLTCQQQTPVTGEFRSTYSGSRWEALPRYPNALEANKYALPGSHFYAGNHIDSYNSLFFVANSFILSFGLPNGSYSRDWAASEGGMVFVSTESGYIEPPENLPLGATARVLKPQEPVKALHSGGGTTFAGGIQSIVAIDANDDIWVLDRHPEGLGFLGYTQRVYETVGGSDPQTCFVPSGAISVTLKGTAVYSAQQSGFFFTQDIISWAVESSTGSFEWTAAPPLFSCPEYHEVPASDYREVTLANGEYVEYRSDYSPNVFVERDIASSTNSTTDETGRETFTLSVVVSPAYVQWTANVPPASSRSSLVWSGRPTG
jgi:hypothetical protein